MGRSGLKLPAHVPGQKHTPVVLFPATARLVQITLTNWECFPRSSVQKFATEVAIAVFPVLPLSHLCAGITWSVVFKAEQLLRKGRGKLAYKHRGGEEKGFDSLLLSQQHFLLGSFMVHLHTYLFISPDSCRFNNCFILVNSSLQLQQSLIWCSGKFLLLSVVRKAIYFWDLNWCERAHTNLLSTNSSLFVLSSWLHPWLRTQIF